MDDFTVRAPLQQKLGVFVLTIVSLGALIWAYWPQLGWFGRAILLIGLFGVAWLGWYDVVKSSTSFDMRTRSVNIARLFRSYRIGFEDVTEVWVPRTGAIRLIVRPEAVLSPLLKVHRNRIPITTAPEGNQDVVTKIADILGVPIRGSYRYRGDESGD